MTQPIHLIGEVYAAEVPEGMEAFEIECIPDVDLYELTCYEFGEYDMPVKEKSIDLPPGNWQIICTTKECTEEQAKGIVERDELFINGKSQGVLYCNYHCSHDVCEWYKYPLDSLRSLLTSKGLDPNKNYVLIKKVS